VADPIREGVAQFASLLPVQPDVSLESTNSGMIVNGHMPTSPAEEEPRPIQDALPCSFGNPKKKGKSKRKGKGKGKPVNVAQSSKPNSKWADKCMYAELLEMTEDIGMSDFDTADGIPVDLETAWVAVTPVPAGKRCLAITHAPSGIAGIGEF
jgi:snurportin-1